MSQNKNLKKKVWGYILEQRPGLKGSVVQKDVTFVSPMCKYSLKSRLYINTVYFGNNSRIDNNAILNLQMRELEQKKRERTLS